MTDLVDSAETTSRAASANPVDRASGAGGDGALAAARQEAATLRGILGAIQDALGAALSRLEALEGQVNGDLAVAGALGALQPAVIGASVPVLPRGGAEWKQPGWTPAGQHDDVVTGETLRARREALGISQAAVAHAANCSRGLVAEVERGKRRSAQTLAHLAAVLDRLNQQARRN